MLIEMALPKSKIKDSEMGKTLEGIVNEWVVRNIFVLESKGYIDYIDSLLKEGKESIILKGFDKDKRKVIIKIFKVEASQFKNFQKYIVGDMRFKGIKKNKRAIVGAWCRKEYSNLRRVKKKGIKVPDAYAYYNNVLVMEFLGHESIAPQLREYEFKNKKEIKIIFDKIIDSVYRIVKDAKLVHADLSPFNILIYENEPYFIDWGQSVLLEHPNAEEFLERDLDNIFLFFEKRGLNRDKEKIKEEMLNIVRGA